MGMKDSTYIGPYMIVTPKLFSKRVEKRQCPHGCTPYPSDAQFCHKHGDPIQLVKKEIKGDTISDVIYSDEFVDKLYQPEIDRIDSGNTVCLLPNYEILERKTVFDSYDDSLVLNMRLINIEVEVKTFVDEYSEIIIAIAEVAENIVYQWGVVHYYS